MLVLYKRYRNRRYRLGMKLFTPVLYMNSIIIMLLLQFYTYIIEIDKIHRKTYNYFSLHITESSGYI